MFILVNPLSRGTSEKRLRLHAATLVLNSLDGHFVQAGHVAGQRFGAVGGDECRFAAHHVTGLGQILIRVDDEEHVTQLKLPPNVTPVATACAWQRNCLMISVALA